MPHWQAYQTEDVEIDLLLQALHRRYGFDFTSYAHASLKRRVRELQHYFDVRHLSEIIPSLLYDERVAQTIVNNITVPVSEFFRDPPVWKVLREDILPRLDSFPRINIWQAGCGRGQETYSLLILLRECDLLKKTRLVATDINLEAMNEAKLGQWPAQDMARWRENYRAAGGQGDFDACFHRQGERVCIDEELRQAVEFNRHNLVADEVFMEAQLIVCRNVLIYFNEKLQERVIDLFARSLQRGGYLLLGRAESIASSPSFQLLGDQHNIYRRAAGAHHV